MEAIVDSLSTDGRGVFHVDHRAVFVSGGMPGDRILVELDEKTKPPSARLIERLLDSPYRIEHPCSHARECAGSVWGCLSYSAQLIHKRELAVRTLRKAIGEVGVQPTVPSPLPWNYRSRITLTTWLENNRLRIGYQTESRQFSGIPIRNCMLGDETIGQCIGQLSEQFQDIEIPSKAHYPRRIQIHRTSCGAGLLLIFADIANDSAIREWSERLRDLKLPGGIWFASGTQAGIIDYRKPLRSTPGSHGMTSIWLGHELEINPSVFTQANAAAADLVHAKLKNMASENKWRTVWDLYGGYGALGCAAAANGSALAVLELTRNSESTMHALTRVAGVKEARFIEGDLISTLPRQIGEITPDDLVILDPPRSGAHSEVIKAIGKSRMRDVYYLSCNPARLGRDLVGLLQAGFQIIEIEPCDFFPQTPRIEVLTRLHRD